MKKFSLLLVLSLFAGTVFSQIQVQQLNDTIVGVGTKIYDLNNDAQNDFQFEIIQLSPGVLAQRVVPLNLSAVLDNSTYGYADALLFGDTIASNFVINTCVLGTFVPSGQFNGQGDRYLGMRINAGAPAYYGWFLINCSFNRDTIIIRSAGFNTAQWEGLLAGQTVLTGVNDPQQYSSVVFPFGNMVSTELQMATNLINTTAELFDCTGRRTAATITNGRMDVSHLNSGMYILRYSENGVLFSGKFVVVRD